MKVNPATLEFEELTEDEAQKAASFDRTEVRRFQEAFFAELNLPDEIDEQHPMHNLIAQTVVMPALARAVVAATKGRGSRGQGTPAAPRGR
jgi:hypothetical protein